MPKLQAATLGGSTDDIEASFYDAMRTGDIDQLMACWADEDDIVCVHPGGPRLIGHASIRAAFEEIFEQGSVMLTLQEVRKVESLTSAMHNVLERVDVLTPQGPQQGYVVATNVYQRTAQGWRMVAHHASAMAVSETLPIASVTSQILH